MIEDFILSTFREAFDFINPYLSNHSEFSEDLAKEIREKEANNVQYNFDLEMDAIFKRKMEEFDITGKIYSEEGGWIEKGDKKYIVVVDPFCNSTLASKTFREAAAGISIFDFEYNMLVSAIIDFQTGIAAIAGDGARFFQIQDKREIKFETDRKTKIEDSWIVISLETPERRAPENMKKAGKILLKSKRVIVSSGHIYWLKLASGFIDGYLDISKGQKLYEMFAASVAQKSGCLVTSPEGEEFSAKKYLKIFEKDPKFRFKLVAASSKALHGQIMDNLG